MVSNTGRANQRREVYHHNARRGGAGRGRVQCTTYRIFERMFKKRFILFTRPERLVRFVCFFLSVRVRRTLRQKRDR